MLTYSQTQIKKVAVHSVGNKSNGEDLLLSENLLDIADEKLHDLLLTFFSTPFSNPEFYSFTFSNDDHTLNPLFKYATTIFESPKTLHKQSINIAKHLYETALHSQIKSGDLFVAYLSDIMVADEPVDAIGIFKSENRQFFLTVENKGSDFDVNYGVGINIEKLDKGCLIFNTDEDSGYKVCVIDKSNKSVEAQYWKDQFLQIKPCADEYHHTKAVMDIAKNFVVKQLKEEFEVSKADQIDFLNRSAEYFKTNETFEKKSFEKEVFQDSRIIKSFQEYDETMRDNYSIQDVDGFEISPQAVKKQSKIFKSVLKLDKNFHIYIHGDRELIERGVEKDGRKYYKIYFDKEA
jgi:hypothetical protein